MGLTSIEGHHFGKDFLNAYEVEGVVGSGMSGIVLRAKQKSLNRTVAIKILNKQSIYIESLKWRFKREAQILADLSHPNVIKVFDYGFDNDVPYLVQDFLEGVSLQDWLDKKVDISIEQVVKIAKDMARALSETHSKGVLHRDIKPANIFCRDDGTFILLDFGLSISDEYCTALTKTGFIVGTPVFMAPEQLKTDEIDPPADINSMGMVLFYLISKKFPFDCTLAKYFYKRMTYETPSLAEFAPNTPRCLIDLIDKCLKLDPKERYKDGQELLKALEKLDLSDKFSVPVQPTREKDESPRSIFRHMAIALPLALAFVLLMFFVRRQTENTTQKTMVRTLGLKSVYPTEAIVQVEATPSCRVTISLFKEKSSTPITKTTTLVEGKKSFPLMVSSSHAYRLTAIFAGRPQKTLEYFFTSPPLSMKLVALPEGLPLRTRTVTGAYEPTILTKGSNFVIATKANGLFSTDLMQRIRWYKPSTDFLHGAVNDNSFVYTLASDGMVKAYEWTTGKLLWHSKAFGKPGKYFRQTNKELFFRTVDPVTLVALKKMNGSLCWQLEKMAISLNWSIVGDKVILPLTAGGVKAIKISNGTLQNGPNIAGGLVTTAFTEFNNSLFVGTYVRAVIGGPWRGPKRFATYVEGEPRIIRADENRIFVLCKAPNQFVALDSESGKIYWQHNLSDTMNHFFAQRKRVFIIETDNQKPSRLIVLNQEDGKVLVAETVAPYQPGRPALYESGVVISQTQQIIKAIELYAPPTE